MTVAILALLISALLVPPAEAATTKRSAKPAATKANRTAKVTPRPRARAAKVAPQRLRATRVSRVAPAAIDEDPTHLEVKSSAALVLDTDGRTLYAKNIESVQPIASITKLMTAMVVLDARLDLNEPIAITEDDIDHLKHTRSRLKIGTVLTRDELLRLALMASENRAASALGRSFPGGLAAFVAAMNRKAADIGMVRTRFVDSSGLSSDNVSTAQDLARMVTSAYRYPIIQEYTTLTEHVVRTNEGRPLAFRNSNGLVKDSTWHIDVSKTGYIQEAGRCLVMQARIAAKPVIIVLLDSWGKYTRIGDANRIKRWMESALAQHTPG
ncbi:MAG TPA: D-alanyl-D-alanine endopeptidase [Burkholderiales bacterium]|nr:D-alanyl-D-alanine endopeptidase [Burkholderiales bacterium]